MSASRKQRGCVMYRRCPVNKAGDCLEEEQGTKAAQNKVAAEYNVLNLKLGREGTGCGKKKRQRNLNTLGRENVYIARSFTETEKFILSQGRNLVHLNAHWAIWM